MIGEGHVVAPHIELPFAQTEHSAQHVSRVNSYPHVDVEAGSLADKPTWTRRYSLKMYFHAAHADISLNMLAPRIPILHISC